jgi:Flp pilus assembly protein TadG
VRRLLGRAARRRRTGLERGQVLPIFAIMSVVLLGAAALVSDVAWMWANQQRMQRAADAGALAGAIYLPGNQTLAFSTARAETAKNGYTNGVGGVVVTPRRDPGDPRKLFVDIDAPVGTFFARAFCFSSRACLTSANVGVTGAATYVLPVPMGSPLAYYGVGDFRIPTRGTSASVGPSAPTANDTPNNWSNANGAFADGGSNHANNNTGARQGYRDFHFAVPAGATIDGIEVSIKARSTDNNGCAIGVDLSWDNGTTYTTENILALSGSFPSAPYPALGGPSDRWGRTWTDTQVGDGSFRLRVRDVDLPDGGGVSCVDSARTDLDYISAKVYYTGATTVQARQLSTAGFASDGGTVLPSQGFWGAIEGQGSNRSTGDAYATGLNGAGVNADYDPQGYDYTIELPQGGSVKIFDPTFCATGGTSAGHYGTGDHWLGNANPVSTYFVLWDTNHSTLRSMHTPTGFTSGTMFENEYQADLITGPDFSDAGEPTNPPDCGEGRITNPNQGGYWHDRWWTLASGLAPGEYRLQVTTTSQTVPNQNADESLENMWSILAQGGGAPKVYGRGRMVSYANIESGGQTFHLAQIDRQSGAGKIVEIKLFDPGDVGQKAWMEILSPDGNSYDPVTFDYIADNGRSGTNVTCIQTYGGTGPAPPSGCTNITTGGTLYQNSWVTITVPLGSAYGDSGLTPPGETEEGWWKIRYTVNSGNDTTTWEVSLRGNPVHLVLG